MPSFSCTAFQSYSFNSPFEGIITFVQPSLSISWKESWSPVKIRTLCPNSQARFEIVPIISSASNPSFV